MVTGRDNVGIPLWCVDGLVVGWVSGCEDWGVRWMGGLPQEELVTVCGLITRQHVGECGGVSDRVLVDGCARSVYTMPEVRYTDCAWRRVLVSVWAGYWLDG